MAVLRRTIGIYLDRPYLTSATGRAAPYAEGVGRIELAYEREQHYV